MTSTLKPPVSLTANGPGRKFWRDILEDYELEPAGLVVLEQMCVARDTEKAAQALIDKNGLLVKGTRGALCANPALAIRDRVRRAFASGLKVLALERADGREARQERTLRGRFAGPEIRRTG